DRDCAPRNAEVDGQQPDDRVVRGAVDGAFAHEEGETIGIRFDERPLAAAGLDVDGDLHRTRLIHGPVLPAAAPTWPPARRPRRPRAELAVPAPTSPSLRRAGRPCAELAVPAPTWPSL